jgi:hypothetical protein
MMLNLEMIPAFFASRFLREHHENRADDKKNNPQAKVHEEAAEDSESDAQQ